MSRHADGDVSAGIASVVLVVVVLIAAAVVTLLWCMLSELFRIYQAPRDDQSRKVLWGALAGFLAVLLLAGVLATQPATTPIGVFLACWGFFVYVVVCLWVDATGRRTEPPVAIPASLSLADVVSWKPAVTTVPRRSTERKAA